MLIDPLAMRLFRAVLAASLVFGAAGAARAEADDHPAPKAETPPYRLVRIITDTHQALLFDKPRGTHVLVDAGDAVGGYDVVEIDDDQVVLSKAGSNREFVLIAGDEAAPTSRVVDPYPVLPPPPPGKITFSAIMLLDPYPDDVLDPYGSNGFREVQAPDPEPAPAPPPQEVAPPEEEAPPPPPREQSVSVSRAVLDAELGDFDAIAADVTMVLSDDGVVLERVAQGSFFHRMGLRDGDLVTSVDGTVIHGLDDASAVYVRLAKSKKFVVEVTRAGAPLTLRYAITAK